MNLSDLKPGMRVRVTFEAEFREISPYGNLLRLEAPPSAGIGRNMWVNPNSEGFQVELAEPEYEPGAAYQSATGGVYIFVGSDSALGLSWLGPGVAGRISFTQPARPMVKLVPEVQDA